MCSTSAPVGAQEQDRPHPAESFFHGNLARQVGVKIVSFKATKIPRSIRNGERKQLFVEGSN